MFAPLVPRRQLTHSSIHSIARWPLCLVLVLPPQALAGVLLLDARVGARLETRKVDGICPHKHLGYVADIRDQPVDHVD